MNDNFKHSLINIFGSTWTIPAAIAASYFLQDDRKGWIYITLTVIVVLLILLLTYIFFGSGKLLSNVFEIIKTNFLNMVSLGIVVFGIYNLIFISDESNIQMRIIVLLFFLVSWTVLSIKIRNFSNIRLLRTFFKENLVLIDGWVATETNNQQQTDYREIPSNGEPLKKLIFTIRPSSPFWRAGFKLTDPNGTVLPLRSNNSLLFHLGSTEIKDRFGVTAYINGKWVESLNKTLPFDKQKPISIRLEVNDKNFIKCFINDGIEFEPTERVDPRILKKAFLAAWGDGHNMRVEFDSIGFLKR